jgi:hypothetical protein
MGARGVTSQSHENREQLEMRGFNFGRRIALSVSMLALLDLSLPFDSQAALAPKPKPPAARTGAALHVLGTSAQLRATINPNGHETSYYFQYGLTTAYTSQTTPANVGGGVLPVKVGQAITKLVPGATYHFRVVAISSVGTGVGRDRVFGAKSQKLKFVIPKPAADVYGSPIIFSGSLSGLGAASHGITLQASPFPFVEPFANIGTAGITDGLGRFSFRIANLIANTQLRLVTLDPLPIYSPIVTLNVAVRVTFSVRSSGTAGLVRLYGTVTPAVKGAKVAFQLLQAVRPGKKEQTSRYVSKFVTPVKHGSQKSSRFSMIVKISKSGRYRAFVKVRPGPVVSGFSTRTIVLHAAPTRRRKK